MTWQKQADQSQTIPKINLIGLKLTDAETTKLKEYASRHGMTITKVLQRGIELQYQEEKSSK